MGSANEHLKFDQYNQQTNQQTFHLTKSHCLLYRWVHHLKIVHPPVTQHPPTKLANNVFSYSVYPCNITPGLDILEHIKCKASETIFYAWLCFRFSSFNFLPLRGRWKQHNSIHENEEDNFNQDAQQDKQIRKARQANQKSKTS